MTASVVHNQLDNKLHSNDFIRSVCRAKWKDILESNTLFSSYVCEMDSGLLKYANYTKRCDYGLYVIENDSAYLIELKGQKNQRRYTHN